ncbi:MAG TPA: DegT/DnrJ/EryC1/StrS family aminotransferase [Candidatus Hodarchaeales archaeon]|nr:DegT/DnrJ/EryC1/StrS family aminotransferase [Candidatus Hodarchaeales archaeon]
MEFISVNTPLLDGNEKDYLIKCIESGWISSDGPFVKEFEQRMAKLVNRRFGVAVSSGTAALEIAVRALNLKQGQEVVLPTFTIISCASAILRSGCRPVLVDCDPQTWNMDVENLEKKITEHTAAIMAVHIYGLPTNMAKVQKIAEKHDLRVIEDAAEMHGQTYNGAPCGSFGDVSVFSFYANKHVTTGEGGMVLTNDESIAKKSQSLRNLCFQAEKRFFHEELGYNFRMTNLQAAVGVAQVERLEEFVKKKRKMGKLYTELLRNVPDIQLPLETSPEAENIYWVYGIVLGDSIKAEAIDIMKLLEKRGIGTRPFFWPIHEQPVFRKMGIFEGERYPVAERLARRGFYLPSGLALEKGQIQRAATSLKDILLFLRKQ